jgi:hypothetical protein
MDAIFRLSIAARLLGRILFASGFRLGDSLPDSLVNALGRYLFPVFASALLWMPGMDVQAFLEKKR